MHLGIVRFLLRNYVLVYSFIRSLDTLGKRTDNLYRFPDHVKNHVVSKFPNDLDTWKVSETPGCPMIVVKLSSDDLLTEEGTTTLL